MNKEKIKDILWMIVLFGVVLYFFYSMFIEWDTSPNDWTWPECIPGTHRLADHTCIEDGAVLTYDN